MVRVSIASLMSKPTFDSVTSDSIPISSSDGGLPSAVGWSHLVIEGRLRPGQIAIDATAGNGHDALFLARTVGPTGKVFIFDVQKSALDSTHSRLQAAGIPQTCFQLLHRGHEALAQTIPAECKGAIQTVMFNLGYLPGSDRSLVTRTETTLSAIAAGLEWLAPKGIMTVVVYPGHEGGAEESRCVAEMANRLPSQDFEVQHIRPVNRTAAPPELWAIWKKPLRGSAT